jgi:plasmid stabilization system protein ParE
VSRELRWTEQAVAQLAAIVDYVSVSSPVYAEHLVNRIVARLDQALVYPDSGYSVPEAATPDIRELLERPYRLMYRVREERIEMIAVVHERGAAGSGVAD